MLTAEIAQLSDLLNELSETFDRKALPAKAVKVWFEVLKEFTYFDVSGLLIGWPKKSTKMPAPADIWKVLNDNRSYAIEMEAVKNKREFQFEADKVFKRNDKLGQNIRQLAQKIQARGARDPKDWAQKIIDRAEDGTQSYISMKWANEQLARVG